MQKAAAFRRICIGLLAGWLSLGPAAHGIAAELPRPAFKDGPDLGLVRAAVDRSPAGDAQWASLAFWAKAERERRTQAALADLQRGAAGQTPRLEPSCLEDVLCEAVLGLDSLRRDLSAAELAQAQGEMVALLNSLSALNAVMDSRLKASDLTRQERLSLLTVRTQAFRALLATLEQGEAFAAWPPTHRKLAALQLKIATIQADAAATAYLRQLLEAEAPAALLSAAADPRGYAFLIVQHADRDPALQLRVLRDVQEASGGKVPIKTYAYLYDRVALRLFGKQRYGTQVGCHGARAQALHLEDAEAVEALRRSAGLETLEAYINRVGLKCPAAS